MLNEKIIKHYREGGRKIELAKVGEEELGPLKLLPGKWSNVPGLPGRGWNMIALPFAGSPPSGLDYRLLLNQYNEDLEFTLVDKGIPNRGIRRNGAVIDTDQFLAGLDYQQHIKQIAATDSPQSDGSSLIPNQDIHHEPGLWLHMANETTANIDIARLATIPHGDSVLALGTGSQVAGGPSIPDISGLPIGVNQDLNNPYLAPYKKFNDNLFKGLFNPVRPNDLLKQANQGVNIVRTTVLSVDTAVETGGIVNIPFIVKHANATEMKSTFWIQELEDGKLRLQYSQVVMLDFFPRKDGVDGLIRWPHVSINTMEKVANPS